MDFDKLLILDIDETLVHTEKFPAQDYFEVKTFDFNFPSSDGVSYYFCLKRPHLDEFLEWAFQNFKVGVWTAAGDVYAKYILDNIGVDVSKLEFFYTKDKCTLKYDYELNQHYGVKNLNKLKKKWNLNKVLVVDDIAATAEQNYGNLIHIKQFFNDRKDCELLKLKNYLEKIKNAENFRSIEKRGWSNNQEVVL